MIRLRFLGPVEAESGGQPLPFRSNKALGLLAYLIVQAQPVTRLTLIDIFWPDKLEREGRNNLSWALSHIQKALPGCLLADRQTVAFTLPEQCWIDLHELQRREQEGTLEALNELTLLYRGDFLSGLELSDCPGFELWVLSEREVWRQRVSAALERLVGHHIQRQAYEAALVATRRWLMLDDWEEKAQRQLMWLLAISGRRTEALAQYDRLKLDLKENLGIIPSAETEAMYAAIRDDRVAPIIVTPQPPFPTTAPVTTSPITLPPERRKQLILLDKVERAWIRGVLAPGLLAPDPIHLAWQSTPEAVARPWEKVNPDYDPLIDLAHSSLVEIWHKADRALLILGEAGAGKTITLLLLAQALLTAAHQDANRPLPVILPLASWAENPTAFKDWLVQELNIKYQIPRDLGRTWLENNTLVLLLDGLDEIPFQHQAQFIRAINAFRADYGLIGLVICSRPINEREPVLRINLGGAITLQPLTRAQIQDYLTDLGLTATSLYTSLTAVGQDDDEVGLEALAHSPLWLSVMAQLFLNANNPETLPKWRISTELPRDLFDVFVHRMFQQRPQFTFNLEQTYTWLSWLAHGLDRHHQALFLLEALQPSWLATRRQRWLYLACTHLIFGAFIGLALSPYMTLRIALFPEAGRVFYSWGQLQLNFLPVQPQAWMVLFLFNILLGGVVAVVSVLHYERSLRRPESHWLLGWRRTLIIGLVVGGITSIPFVWFDGWQFGLAASSQEAFLFVLTLSYRRGRQSYLNDIRTVEVLTWSWQGMLQGAPLGLGAGAVLGMLAWPFWGSHVAGLFVYVFGSISMLINGLRPNHLVQRAYPNQGVWLSLRNAALAGLLFAIVLSVPVHIGLYQQVSLAGLYFSSYVFLIVAAIYGGYDLIRHLCLRGILWLTHTTPFHYIAFLESAVARGFLRRAGGAYLFWHRALQDYFIASR